jgi:hypothetical protein
VRLPPAAPSRVWACGLVVAAAVLILLAPATADAATSGASATFSGSLNGHLATPVADCSGVTAQSGEIDFYHSLAGHGGSEWSLFFNDQHAGTWKGRGGASTSSFSLQSSAGMSVSWVGKSGSFTTKGSAGTVNMILKPQIGSSGHGLVHVKGSWNCP